MECALCNAEMPDDTDKAIDQGWLPHAYKGKTELGPICPNCAEHHCSIASDGEAEITQTKVVPVHFEVMVQQSVPVNFF